MKNHKIVFTGPVGAGKTTAIASISDIAPVTTDETATDSTRLRKAGTTVAMDYGVMNLSGSERLHLYGTPGQERFSFMWDILTEGGIGLVLLINNNAKDPMGDLTFFLEAFKDFIDETRVVIGLTRVDETAYPMVADYHQYLEKENCNIPIFQIDARERRDVATLLEALIYSLDPGLVN